MRIPHPPLGWQAWDQRPRPRRRGSTTMDARPNIVLVHGAWADGFCWSGVIERLQADGYHVTAPQFPLTALADDVARLRHVLELQDGPTIVAGHSYGGQIVTALGTDAPNAVGLVYIAAFALDEGETLGGLLSQGPTPPALEHLFTDKQGFAWLSEDDFVHHFAARRRTAVRQPHGRHDRRGGGQPRGDGLAPGRSRPTRPHRGGGSSPCR
jgi:pimeloyl-ACP methyl ester carboxylesterase